MAALTLVERACGPAARLAVALPLAVAVAVAVVLAGCGKQTTSVTTADGQKIKVESASDGAHVTSTDAQGNTVSMDLDNAKLTEADFGLPIYPGATVTPKSSTRIKTPDGTSVTASFESKDSADKVAAFYRELLRARSAGKQLMDDAGGSSVALTLMDGASGTMQQVSVAASGAGASIQMHATLPAAK